MPRSSRHKSARSHKHGSKDGRDRSDSEDERIPKERKMKVEEPPAASSKGSREVDLEKRKAPVKDLIGSSNGDASGEKKRKDRSDDLFVSDRWAGGGEDDQTVGKKIKGEGSEAVDSDKVAKPNAPAVDVKARSSRKGEVLAEMNEDSASRSESAKRRLEKESSRRESGGSQHREAKDREREHLKDAKEKEREYMKDAKEEREYSKDAKEKEREYPKDAKYREIDHPKDAKDRERDHLKDGKERDRHYTKDVKERGRDQSRDEKDRDRDTPLKDSKERDRDYSKDSKERDRDYSKDSKDREKDYPKDGKDRDRDHHKDTKERVRGYTKDTKDRDKDPPKDANELDREHFKDAKERNREQPKDAKDRDREHTKDAKERDRGHPKDAKERDRDYPNDTRERDRDYSKDAKEREREYYKDTKERERGYIMDIKDRERDYGKEGKERDKGRGLDHDKKVQDSRYERSDDVGSRKQVSKNNSSQNELPLKKDVENSDGKRQGDLRNTEVEKELDRRSSRRRDSSGDKYLGDGRDDDERRVASRDDPAKNASYKDESHRDEKYRDKYRDDVDRVQKHHDERGRNEHFSRDHGSNRSDNKHFRDDSRISDSRYKKSKIQDSDHDASPYVDDHGTKLKDNRGRKRFSDQNDEHSEFKPRNAKELREDTERHASSLGKLDTHTDRNRVDYASADKTDSSLGSNRPKSSPRSGNYAAKEQNRSSSKQAGLSCRRSDETLRSNTESRGEHATGVHERISDSRSLEKIKTRDGSRFDGLVDTSSTHYDRATKSEAHTLPLPLVGKSPSDRRLSDRTADRTGARRNLDIDGQRSINMKDGRSFSNIRDRDRVLPLEKPTSGDLSHDDMPRKEAAPVGLASFNRSGHFSGSSPSRIPPLHLRHGIDSSSGHGSYDDDSKVGERKPYSRYRRSVEPTIGRGQGNAWKNAPSWPSPVANGFIPLPTGPPHSGFHNSVHQFPGPSLFGVRPSMDLNHTGLPYHMHERPDRFSGHVRPFGWHNPVDDCPPHLQAWDGSAGVFGDESHVYGRSQWDMNKHLIGNRGWEMRADVWKGRNGNINMEIPASQESEYPPHAFSDEIWTGKIVHNERAQSEQRPVDSSEIKSFNEKSPVKTNETTQKCIIEKIPESIKTRKVLRTSSIPSYHDSVHYCCNYLSKIDISCELSTPDLYNQCASLLAAGDTTSIYNADKREHRKDYKSDTTVAAKGTNTILSPLFPKITDGVFQRAMSLYKKQNEGRKAMYSVSPAIYVEEQEPLEGSGQPKEVDNPMNSVNTSELEIMKPADNHTSTDASLANIGSTGHMESTASIDTVGLCAENSKEQSDSITDAVHFVEGLQSCEALLPECRVNLSRIHLSPGSTH